jgi:hypothetical protein
MLKSLVVLFSLITLQAFAEGTSAAGASQQGTTVQVGEYAATGTDSNVTNACGDFAYGKDSSLTKDGIPSETASQQ